MPVSGDAGVPFGWPLMLVAGVVAVVVLVFLAAAWFVTWWIARSD